MMLKAEVTARLYAHIQILQTKVILRNQSHTSHRPACCWFKMASLYRIYWWLSTEFCTGCIIILWLGQPLDSYNCCTPSCTIPSLPLMLNLRDLLFNDLMLKAAPTYCIKVLSLYVQNKVKQKKTINYISLCTLITG